MFSKGNQAGDQEGKREGLFLPDRVLLLPGDPGFDETLCIPPPAKDCAYIVPTNLGGVMVAVDPEGPEFQEYMEGGEYEARINDIDESWLFLPDSYYVDFD